MSTLGTARSAAEIADAKQAADLEFGSAVKDGFAEVLVKSDLAKEDGDGPDNAVAVDRIYDELKTKHVKKIGAGPGEPDDRFDPATSSSKEELTRAVVTAAPSPSDVEQDAVHAKIWEKCQSLVWNLTTTSMKRGRVQKKLDADRLILVRGKVYRNGNTINDGVYVSTQEEVVVREFIGPHLAKLKKISDALEEDYSAASERVPGLDTPMRAAIEAALVEVTATLPVTTLESGNGHKALGK